MNPEPSRPTAQERLAVSRHALLARSRRMAREPLPLPAAPEPLTRTPAPQPAPRDLHSYATAADDLVAPHGKPPAWDAVARALFDQWWQRHPANAAGRLAMPVVRRTAREHPYALLAGAAAFGAVLVMTRPWRALPRGVRWLPMLLGTSQLAGVITALLEERTDEPS